MPRKIKKALPDDSHIPDIIPQELLDRFVTGPMTGHFGSTFCILRDRNGAFEPKLIGKHERRFTGFDDKIIGIENTEGTKFRMKVFNDFRTRSMNDI